MGLELTTKALVLHEMPIGDYDKRVILLTKNYGKITAFAKGARKPNSQLLAGSQVFSYGDFILYKGKNTYNIKAIELIETFQNLRRDMSALAYALYVMEFTEYVSEENVQNHDYMKLILKTLKHIELGQIDIELIIKIFELKSMKLLGFTPWVMSCVSCNRKDNNYFFSATQGGLLCIDCLHKDSGAIPIKEGTRYTLEYILTQPVENLFKFKIDQSIFNEIQLVMQCFIDYNLNKKFKTLEFLRNDM